ncbi:MULTISPECIES: DUF5708 family protein [Streptomyces]|uniref:DUF5708 family protein n=1 Tax=Streptomyces lonegramiae TaxID=3075524 RepID=A0ABU2XUB4_9ACTN|nr:DUF5708 family protein [Streptomyces sp. DSM 41529]MDT0549515.1 DUF5708 family protein [Streptomyces sp. DSM 41529]
MTNAYKQLLEGSVTLVVGLALWLFAGDIELPVVELPKIGVVMMCWGGVQLLYGSYLGAAGQRSKG